ncbi:MAG TPA: hypothetical protein VIK30_03515 [Polyangia bacterium]
MGRSGLAISACAAALACVSLGASCSKDIFDVTVNLSSETYSANVGTQSGTIPTVTCDPAAPTACTGGQAADANGMVVTTGPATVGVTLSCDAATVRCFAQVNVRVVYPVDVSQDDAFVAAVAQRSISLVRLADLAYTVPVNTLTFEAPAVDIYVGPAGTALETDPGVVMVGSTAPIPAGTPVTAAQHVTIADGSPGRALIEESVQAEQPFVLMLTMGPRIEAGDPIPAGTFEVDLSPLVQLGF